MKTHPRNKFNYKDKRLSFRRMYRNGKKTDRSSKTSYKKCICTLFQFQGRCGTPAWKRRNHNGQQSGKRGISVGDMRRTNGCFLR